MSSSADIPSSSAVEFSFGCMAGYFSPLSTSGSSMLSRTVNVSSRLNSWNTNPRLSRRKSASFDSFIFARSIPSRITLPPVGLSSAARIFSSVVFPEPLSPIIAMYSPGSAVKLTFFSASTRFPPRRVV